MKTLDEAWALIESLNEEAHSDAWDSWIAADEMADSDEDEDGTTAEQMREEASDEQAGYFRQGVWALDEEDQATIEHWLKEDESFREQFRDWFGHDAFDEEYNTEEDQ
jgi:hypothetical protein